MSVVDDREPLGVLQLKFDFVHAGMAGDFCLYVKCSDQYRKVRNMVMKYQFGCFPA